MTKDILHPHRLSLLALIGIALILVTTVSGSFLSFASKQSIEWNVQITSAQPTLQSVGMCKGITEETNKVGFIGNELGSIWRTQDGVNWAQVVQFPSSANWYGVFCFPDAMRVIAVGFSDGDSALEDGAIITWSFDGGDSWTDREPMPQSGPDTWLQSVYFYDDMHGVILPFKQDSLPLAYYTTNGGKNASDWNAVPLDGPIEAWQSHAISAFGGITKAFARSQDNDTAQFCTSGNAGQSWVCEPSDHGVLVGSFVTSREAIGVDANVNVYSTRDGGSSWTQIAALPNNISSALLLPTDMLWIPNSDVVVLTGGNQSMGSLAHSVDRGLTWVVSIPQLPSIMFTSIDWAATSPWTTEVWTTGVGGGVSLILHATVSFS